MLTVGIVLATVFVECVILYLGFKYGLFPKKYKKKVSLMKA